MASNNLNFGSKDPKQMLWYLASPYSGNEEENFGKALFLTAHLLEHEKLNVWSPIVYVHEMHIEYEPLTYDNWLVFDKLMLGRCDGLLVAAIDGFEKSRGVKMEVGWAKERGIPIKFVEWNCEVSGPLKAEADVVTISENETLVSKLLAPTSEEEITSLDEDHIGEPRGAEEEEEDDE